LGCDTWFFGVAFAVGLFTFANGGYIIRVNPMANGILVVSLENELIKPL
jgi:hypothetical protein